VRISARFSRMLRRVQDLQLPESLRGVWSSEAHCVLRCLLLDADPGRTRDRGRAARVVQEVCHTRGMCSSLYTTPAHSTYMQVTQSDAIEEQENSVDMVSRLGLCVVEEALVSRLLTLLPIQVLQALCKGLAPIGHIHGIRLGVRGLKLLHACCWSQKVPHQSSRQAQLRMILSVTPCMC
jgi:hypothetical protein